MGNTRAAGQPRYPLCTLSGLGSSFSISGNTLTMTFALTFTGTWGTWSGLQNAYVYAYGNNGLSNGGWQLEGTWTPQ
jgi:hypothetical protein